MLRIVALSSRTASILAAPPNARFLLPAPLDWRLISCGHVVVEGRSDEAVLFVEGLIPDTSYRLECALGPLDFHTPTCAGTVDAAGHGLSESAPDNAAALARAVAATPTGGTLVVQPGLYATGPVFLRPDMTLYLPQGVTLAALADWSDWPILPAQDENGRPLSSWEGVPAAAFAAPLTAIGCHGLTITGRGVIDGGGDRGDWWTWPKGTRRGARRPRTLFLGWSDDVQLSGVTVRNSPSWTVHPLRCDRLTAAALRIQNPPDSPNTDGFNPESCCDVTVTGVHFSVGDDCIAIKAGKRLPGQTGHLAPTRRMTVSHCHMARGHGGVVIGSEMSGGVSDITVSHCDFTGTDRGLRIKTRRGRGGCVERIRLEDSVMTNVATPLAVNAFYFCDPDGHDDWVQNRAAAPVDATTPELSDITVARVTATGVKLAAAALLGLPESPIRRVRIIDMALDFDPAAQPGIPLMADGQQPVRHALLVSDNAEVDGTPFILEPEKGLQSC